MAAVLDQSPRPSRRRRSEAVPAQQRLDIQGLRMVAVVAVFAFHLCGWPRGGFIGVDVFFVITGFLITGSLLRSTGRRGSVSIRRFYWNRVRRILPAASAVLLCTYLASVVVFPPSRARQVGVDAWSAFIFMSNWRFAAQQPDYFAAEGAVSPVQHYWAVSIAEQFYLVWPALIFVIGLIVVRMAWTRRRQMKFMVAVVTYIVIASLAFALHATATWPTWAYFNTFARVWELGVGALLATAVGTLGRIPPALKSWLSWGGLALIAAGLLLIPEAGFPAPWALLPVTGAALVIAAGVEHEPPQAFLRNPASVYLGDISYSLYLVHWPVIVFLAAQMPRGGSFFFAAGALTFALAVGCYHFVENPLRYFDWRKTVSALREIPRGGFQPQRSIRPAAAAVLMLSAVGLTAYALGLTTQSIYVPPSVATPAPSPMAARPPVAVLEKSEAKSGPLASALQVEITAALSATQWPPLDPSMEAAMVEPLPSEIQRCSDTTLPSDEECTWGATSAPTRIVMVGDDAALNYANSLRELALNSGDQIQIHLEAMGGCPFNNDQQSADACTARKQRAVDYITANRPTVVLIANSYGDFRAGDGRPMTTDVWFDSVRQIVGQIRDAATKLAFLSPPPADKNIEDCYGTGSSVPANCISRVTDQWASTAAAEKRLAESVGGLWVDSRPWFCSGDGRCPGFVGTTPTKRDATHPTRAYGERIVAVIDESLRAAGVY